MAEGLAGQGHVVIEATQQMRLCMRKCLVQIPGFSEKHECFTGFTECAVSCGCVDIGCSGADTVFKVHFFQECKCVPAKLKSVFFSSGLSIKSDQFITDQQPASKIMSSFRLRQPIKEMAFCPFIIFPVHVMVQFLLNPLLWDRNDGGGLA